MASKGEVNVAKMFTQLQLASEDGDYEWGLDVIDNILKALPDDLDALSCQLVCYIQTSDFNQALKVIDKLIKLTGKDTYQYERAYCLYKQEQYEKSLQLLNQMNEKESLRVLDLQSQLYYRLGRYRESVEGFRKGSLMKENNERTANMAAALCYCDQPIVELNTVSSVTMEQCFNLGTVYTLVAKDYKTAESLLLRAEKLCQESDNDEEDIEADLVPIRIQLAYTLQLMGRNEEALSLYSNVLKLKPSPVHQLTAANNIIVINGDKDIFDSKKKIKLLTNEVAVKKLNRHQLGTVLFNRCMFALRINQLEQCRTVLKEMKSTESELNILAQSSLLCREKKVTESISLLEQYLSSCSSPSLSLYLMLAQLYWDNGNHNKAELVLESIPNVVQYLGAVAMIVSLRKMRGDDSNTFLNNVLEYWKGTKSNRMIAVVWEVAQYMLESDQSQLAANVLEWLYNEDKTNTKYLAYLVSAYSRFNPKRAEELSHSLPSLGSSQSIDVLNLEQMPTFASVTRRLKVPLATTTEPIKQQKKKKKRKRRLPKDVSKPIDPERWLPLRERSYYRKSKKKGQSSVGKGTQGMSASMVAMAAKLDASKPRSPDGTSEASPRNVKQQPAKKQQQQKKKKKGKR